MALHLPGMSLLVVTIKCCHVALEVLLQLIEGAHCLIKCPRKTTTYINRATTGMLADRLHNPDFDFTDVEEIRARKKIFHTLLTAADRY